MGSGHQLRRRRRQRCDAVIADGINSAAPPSHRSAPTAVTPVSSPALMVARLPLAPGAYPFVMTSYYTVDTLRRPAGVAPAQS